MPAAKRSMLQREGSVSSWTLDIYARAEGKTNARSRGSAQYLILEGEFIEPLKGVARFSVQLSPADEPDLGAREIPTVGSVLRVKPEVQAAGTLTSDEFRSVLLLASAGKLRTFGMVFQEPRYGSALIASFSFSTDDPAADE